MSCYECVVRKTCVLNCRARVPAARRRPVGIFKLRAPSPYAGGHWTTLREPPPPTPRSLVLFLLLFLLSADFFFLFVKQQKLREFFFFSKRGLHVRFIYYSVLRFCDYYFAMYHRNKDVLICGIIVKTIAQPFYAARNYCRRSLLVHQ